MKCFTVKRITETDDGTFGVLLDGKIPFALTLENKWMDNKVGVSCIPVGDYTCNRRWYNKGGYQTFEITDVEGRTHILFHIGNRDENTEGCILVAEEYGKLHGTTAILDSGKGFKEFMERLQDVDEFLLHITNNF